MVRFMGGSPFDHHLVGDDPLGQIERPGWGDGVILDFDASLELNLVIFTEGAILAALAFFEPTTIAVGFTAGSA